MELDYEAPRIELVHDDKPIKAESIDELDHGYLNVKISDDDEEWGDHEEMIVGPGGVVRIWEGHETAR